MVQDIYERIRELRSEDKNLKEYGLLEKSTHDSGYTHRERFLRTMHFQSVDRVPNHEFGYWTDTLKRWHDEGLPEEIDTNEKADVFFGFDPTRGFPIDLGLNPYFEYQVLEETERYRIVRDGGGAKAMVYTDGSSTIPHYLEFPIKDRATWEEFKFRLDPNDPKRYAHDWEAIGKSFENCDVPIHIGTGSLFGWIRDWWGFEGVSVACYDYPDVIEEMIEHLCVFICTLLEHSLRYVKLDYGWGWEDIAFNHGPIISPTMFKEWLVPRYKRISDLLKQHGADVYYVDCDGNVNVIVEHWLDAGVNCMFPIEVNGGTDPVALREKFGHRVLLAGGVDKIQLIKGKQTIDQEMERLRKTVEDGGFIPHVDHRVPPDVSYENYLYYLRAKRSIIG